MMIKRNLFTIVLMFIVWMIYANVLLFFVIFSRQDDSFDLFDYSNETSALIIRCESPPLLLFGNLLIHYLCAKNCGQFVVDTVLSKTHHLGTLITSIAYMFQFRKTISKQKKIPTEFWNSVYFNPSFILCYVLLCLW